MRSKTPGGTLEFDSISPQSEKCDPLTDFALSLMITRERAAVEEVMNFALPLEEKDFKPTEFPVGFTGKPGMISFPFVSIHSGRTWVYSIPKNEQGGISIYDLDRSIVERY
jgi:hypothetical protein